MAKEQILKLVNATDNKTHYVFFPERIFDLTDTAKGCLLSYSTDPSNVLIANTTARQMKRSIQEQIDHPMGFLKLESVYKGHKGKRYVNVDHIAGLIDHGDKTVVRYEHHITYDFTVLEKAFDVAYQIRRVIKRLDQDAELCCEPTTETEAE